LVSSVCCRRWQLASCWHLLQSPTSCCLRCPKRWKSQGARMGLYGGWSITSQSQHSNQSQSQLVVLYGAQWHLFGPLKHLVGKHFATDTNMELSPPGYKNVALTSMQLYKPLCHGDTIVEKSVATVKVWCVPSVTHVPSVHRSHNKVLLIRVFICKLIFCKFLVTWPTRLEWLTQKHPMKKQNSLKKQCLLSITKRGIFWSINFRLSCLILVTWTWLTVAEIY
jgi:hypothetical protein